MFERFTDRARRVVVLAQEEARTLDHNYVGPEHLLLGLVREGEGVAAKALTELGVDLSAVRQQIEELIGRGQESPSGRIPFTPRTKKVLELSLREALQLGHNYIGTEHILLAILREGENVGAQVLVRMGTNLNQVRLEVVKLITGAAALVPGEGEGPSGEIRSEPSGEARSGVPREVRLARRAVSQDFLLTEVRGALANISERLTAIERHLGMSGASASTGGASTGSAEDSREPPGDATASEE
jgi:ATP-dependent Clp protease ATP-binding subunit ClpA